MLSHVGALLIAERSRWILWLPVLIGLGAGAYYALTFEPPWWVGPTAVLVSLALVPLSVAHDGRLILVTSAVALGLGFSAAQIRTWLAAAPVLDRPLRAAVVTGRVIDLDRSERRTRVVLDQVRIERRAPDRTPARVRLSFGRQVALPQPGTVIAIRAGLYPPALPAAPGAYDFQFRAFFERIGAVGFALGPPRPVPTGAGGSGSDGDWRTLGETLRQRIAHRVTAAISDPAGAALTVALMTGERGAIPAQVDEDFRRSGLSHLLSISGLHLAMVAGLVFFLVRLALAAVPWLALRFPIKKWAAAAGLAAAWAYMLLVGAAVPTLRAVLMTGLVMIAILCDRNPLSQRLVAVAATAILLVEPESMLGPSFQMSFAAVMALIALSEATGRRWRDLQAAYGLVIRVPLAIAALAATSAVATAATTPFSLFHFQQANFYGVISNLLAVPLTAYLVMPAAVAGYALLPFGWEQPALTVMAWGLEILVGLAAWFAALPGSLLLVPPMPLWGLLALVGGGLWLLLWRLAWRWLGLVPMAAGLLSLATVTLPDVLVSDDGRLMAVRTAAGGLSLSGRRTDSFTAETWQRRYGASVPLETWPPPGTASRDGRLRCDGLGCWYQARGRTVALVRDVTALEEDCALADLVVSAVPARYCRAPTVVDPYRLRRSGALAIHLDTPIRMDGASAARGERPWTGPSTDVGKRHVGRLTSEADPP